MEIFLSRHSDDAKDSNIIGNVEISTDLGTAKLRGLKVGMGRSGKKMF